MQRFGVCTRAHATTAAMQRSGVSARRGGFSSLLINISFSRQLSSFSSGPEHDDFWAAAKTEAQATPAYQQAANATASAPSTPTASGDRWAKPGGPSPGTMPMGEAYRPSSSRPSYDRSGNTSNSDSADFMPTPPTFDMQNSMHLSPVRQADVRSFKGRALVDIRQYFRGGEGQAVPTKKGISLTIPQWRRLQEAMADIDREILALDEQQRSVAAINAHLLQLAEQPFEVGDEEPDKRTP